MNRGALRECKIKEHQVNGICIMCSTGYGHGPALKLYDRKTGDYIDAPDDACTARWATTGTNHIQGEICGRPATHEADDILLCDHHYERLWGWVNKILNSDHLESLRRDAERSRLRMELQEVEAKRLAATARECLAAEQQAVADISIVYYVQRHSDGLIKIGTTYRPRERFTTLKGAYGPLRLLATHGGTRRHESALHGQFRRLHAEGREWFRPGPLLLEHIAEMRQIHEVCADAKIPVVGITEIRAMIRDPAKRIPAA